MYIERIDLEETDSTNNEAKRMFLSGRRTPVVISAAHQTAGRGRNNRSFYSPKDTGIYMSVLVPLKEELSRVISVTTAVSVITAEALEKYAHVSPKIKWVNDLYMNDRKVCGILAEAVFDGSDSGIVVGIGINVSTGYFPEEIADIAASVGEIEGDGRDRIIDYIASLVVDFAENPDLSRYIESYREKSLCLGKRVTYTRGNVQGEGIAESIDEEGALLIRKENGDTDLLNSGEISLRIKN